VEFVELEYRLHEETLTAEVIESPNGKYNGNIVIPSTVTYDSVTYTFTKIGDEAFYRCWNLNSITIPKSVTHIEDWAFSFCDDLTSVTILNKDIEIGDRAFSNCPEVQITYAE